MIHYPDKNRYQETISLCGESIDKVHTGYGRVYRQNSTKVTANFYLVDCVDCLKTLLIKKNDELSKIAQHINALGKGELHG